MPTFLVDVEVSSVKIVVSAKDEDTAMTAAEKVIAKKLGIDEGEVTTTECTSCLVAKEEK